MHKRRQAYCLPCHNAYMRAWTKSRSLTPEQRKRDAARSYANVYLRRGKLTREPCLHCGSMFSQMHHPDYDKPLDVLWLCRKCHMAEHAA
jgi:hypothetical protein